LQALDSQEAGANGPRSGPRSRSGPDFGPADATQGFNLEGKLDGPVSKLQVLGFQTFEQVVTPFAVGSRAGAAGPRKLENGSGFFPVRYASASYPAH
jgi:hypothetical protein